MVAALKSGIKAFANAVRREAVQNKKFTEELVYNHGIRSEITPNALKGITKDMFTPAGKLSESGSNEVKSIIKEFGLSQNATWSDILSALVNIKKNAPLVHKI